MPDVFNEISSVALQTAASALSSRQRVIADNIANIETPGFLAGKLKFEDALASAVESGQGTTSWSVARSLEPTRTNGNNVNLDQETLSNIDTGLRYQLVTQAINTKFMILSAAMK